METRGRLRIPSPAQTIVCAAASLPLVYLFWVGLEKFYYESWGTWIVSPAIYPRLLAAPWDSWLRRAIIADPLPAYILMAIPVAMMILAAAAAAIALSRNSLRMATVSLLLMVLLFGTYHFLQPMGISFVLHK